MFILFNVLLNVNKCKIKIKLNPSSKVDRELKLVFDLCIKDRVFKIYLTERI